MLATVVLGEAFEAVDMHTYLFRSTDFGETWNNEGRLYPGTKNRITSDYSRIVVLPNGELVVLMLCADRSDHPDEGLTNSETLGFVPSEFVTFRSKNNGHIWNGPNVIDSPLGNTPLELCSPITPVKDGRCFIPTSTWKYWDGSIPAGLTGEGDNMTHLFNVLKFGAPCITRLPDGTIFLAFWGVENSISVIRWFKLMEV